MAFSLRNKQDVLTGIMNDLRDAGITYVPQGSKARQIANALAREFDIAYKFFDSNFDQAFLSNASDDLLDALAALFGVRRITARKAFSSSFERSFVFYVDDGSTFGDINGGASFTIPAGTVVSTPSTGLSLDQIDYQLLSDVVCASGERVAFTTIEALTEGSKSNLGRNSLVEHAFTSYTQASSESLRCTNRFAIVNGVNLESNTELRGRVAIAATAQQAGNSTALRFALLSVPGIIDIRMIPYFDGIGSVGAFIAAQDNSISPSLVVQGQAAVNNFASAGEVVTVYSPNRVGVDFTTHVNLARAVTINEQNQIERKLISAANAFFTSLGIGEDLDITQLIVALQRTDSLIVNFGSEPSITQFDTINMYRYSDASGQRVRRTLIDGIQLVDIEDHEILIPELSIATPFQFTFDTIA